MPARAYKLSDWGKEAMYTAGIPNLNKQHEAPVDMLLPLSSTSLARLENELLLLCWVLKNCCVSNAANAAAGRSTEYVYCASH